MKSLSLQVHVREFLMWLIILLTFLPSLRAAEIHVEDHLLGVDKNKNFVRDDVETFIGEDLKKEDPKIKKAYINLAQTYHLYLKNRFNKKKLEELNLQLNHDQMCLERQDKAEGVGFSISKLIRFILNTPERKEAMFQANTTLKESRLIDLRDKTLEEICRD